MKIKATLVLLVLSLYAAAQSVQSPSEFLGYAWGSKFAPHHQVVSYVEYIARTLPQNVKIVRYGSSYEGRPLMAAIIANEQNLKDIEEIRTNNLKSIGLLSGTPTKKQPAITWLSYNVHGNEACATTAAIQAFYDLVRKDNPTAQQVLGNSVVIMDFCLNPDGYDRYVNWYNQKVGRIGNPSLSAWEHYEPWPGGRPNHYLFDLNRDWAWQTQKETQERIAFYNSWMPHLHADFHEQGVNNPYYFPPSAKPYHEDITQWQREMQGVIGEYQRKYFDKNGWLYFTRENFDLFYPSYGDTYPTYNGAIGYTLEQGGSGRAGLGVETDTGDTLTLKQRADHHAASSWAAMEAVSSRADKIVSEFVKFYETAKTNPIGNYKSFVIKNKNNDPKVRAFTKFLDKQGFQYGYGGKEAPAVGFSFQDDKIGPLKVEPDDIVISMYQPRSTYLKILLEPKSALEDSVTYDITSWSLPYAYGLQAYGVKEKLTPAPKPSSTESTTAKVEKPYAYVVRWQTVEDAAFLGHLLNKKIKVRAAEKAFEMENQSFAPGTLIIPRAGNEALGAKFDALIREEAEHHGISLYHMTTGYVTKGSDFGSGNVNTLKAPRVAVLAGDGTSSTSVGDVWHFFDQQIKYPATMMTPEMMTQVDLKQFDVIVMPSGNYGRVLNERSLNSLKDWIRSGGRLIAMENAVGALAGKPDFEIKTKEEDKKKEDKTKESANDDLKVYGNREREFVMEETPGSIFKLTMDNTHPLAFGYDKTYYGLILEASNYAFLKDGWNVGHAGKSAWITGFAGKNARKKLENSLLYGVQDLGRGKVIYMVNNPLFRGFWYNGKLLFGNAVFMVN
ncbi:MAG: M14 family zinc carboxypeptidase [Spirosomataceae bacterium]